VIFPAHRRDGLDGLFCPENGRTIFFQHHAGVINAMPWRRQALAREELIVNPSIPSRYSRAPRFGMRKHVKVRGPRAGNAQQTIPDDDGKRTVETRVRRWRRVKIVPRMDVPVENRASVRASSLLTGSPKGPHSLAHLHGVCAAVLLLMPTAEGDFSIAARHLAFIGAGFRCRQFAQ